MQHLPSGNQPNPSKIDPADDHRVLIVVGAHPRAEAFDRPLAYALRERLRSWIIDNPTHPDPAHQPPEDIARTGAGGRVIVVTDVWYLNDTAMRERPTISIGGPGVNALSAYLADKLPSAFVIDDVLMVQLDVEFLEPLACCWGMTPDSTAAAVEAFAERYLDRFMSAACAATG